MAFGFSSIGHALAWLGHEIVAGTKKVETVAAKVQSEEPIIEAISGIAYPPAVLIEKAAFGLLGKVGSAVTTLDSVEAAKGLNLTLDEQEISEIKAVVDYLKQHPLFAASVTTTAK